MAQTSAETDREALVALYQAMDGPNWKKNTNWLSDAPLEEWSGVITDSTGRVNGLLLHWNQLAGPIPPHVGNLTNLELLYLSSNDLSRGISAEMGILSNLTLLWLSSNNLRGEIPPQLGNLPNLEYLQLANNQLSGEIPTELVNLANLEYLLLSNNKLSGRMPTHLGSLANLEWLEISENQLSGEISAELGGLASLRGLRLDGNQLNGCVPSCLQDQLDDAHTNLGDLRFCQSSEAPTATPRPAQTQSERETLVQFYHATGGPNWMDNTNWLSDAPLDEWHHVSTDRTGRVIQMDLRNNQLTGEIPSELGKLVNLTVLGLSGNQLNGEIPAELGNPGSFDY